MDKRKRQRIVEGCAVLAIILLLYVFGAAGVFTSNTMRILLKIALYCSLGTMWNLMSGFTGMTSLGQQSFIGISGYALCVLTAYYGLSYWTAFAVGGILSAVLAFLMAVILFRMRGMYFAVATWVVAEAFKTWFTSWSFVKQGAGMTVKLQPYPSSKEIYFLAIGLMIISLAVVYGILRSKTGLGLTAMRDDADAASSMGVNIFRSKLFCFVVCGFFTGITGVVFYLNKGSIFPAGGFGIEWTVSIVFIVIIGGVGTTAGPVVGAVLYVFLSEYLANYPGYSNIILGVIAILFILFLPDGIMGTLQKRFRFEIFTQKRLPHT